MLLVVLQVAVEQCPGRFVYPHGPGVQMAAPDEIYSDMLYFD